MITTTDALALGIVALGVLTDPDSATDETFRRLVSEAPEAMAEINRIRNEALTGWLRLEPR